MESGEYPHIIILESVRLEAEGVTTIPVKQRTGAGMRTERPSYSVWWDECVSGLRRGAPVLVHQAAMRLEARLMRA
jgi:hypothetical protein